MSWTLTYTGRQFHPTRVEPSMINIMDIAHALSNLCRFSGHTERFYSVAQHSVIVSALLKSQGHTTPTQLAGLMHDATEAYLIDLPQPIKRLPAMKGYCVMEDKLAEVIQARFDLDALDTPVIKQADLIALAMEARDLMNDPQDWESLKGIVPPALTITPWEPQRAKIAFLEAFLELGGRP